MHRRYTLWESNSLATIIKNYEGGNMERILSAALLLEYKRALLAAGDAIDPADYLLTSSPDTNASNLERLSKSERRPPGGRGEVERADPSSHSGAHAQFRPTAGGPMRRYCPF